GARQVREARQELGDPVEAAGVGDEAGDPAVEDRTPRRRCALDRVEARDHRDPGERPDVEVGAGEEPEGARERGEEAVLGALEAVRARRFALAGHAGATRGRAAGMISKVAGNVPSDSPSTSRRTSAPSSSARASTFFALRATTLAMPRCVPR